MENISVGVRLRALSKQEEREGFAWKVDGRCIIPQDGRVDVDLSRRDDGRRDTNDGRPRPFTYIADHVFGPECSNELVYHEAIQGLVHEAVEGKSVTIMVYGQTGSGKTYTMGTPESPGIVQRALVEIFDLIAQNAERDYLLRFSYLEIYNENVTDLLTPDKIPKPLLIKEDKVVGPVVLGLSEEIVTCPEDVLRLLKQGEARRHVASSKMNERSNRSHAVARMVLESRPRDCSNVSATPLLVSSLVLVDLAGSESVAKTGAEGERLKESSCINKSLLALGEVVYKLSEGAQAAAAQNPPREGKLSRILKPFAAAATAAHIPYRDSKLTRILKPSLGGNAKTFIICTINPALRHVEESHRTLRFALRAKRVVNNVMVTEVVSETAALRWQAKELKEQQRKRAAEAGSSSGSTRAQIAALRTELVRSEVERAKAEREAEAARQLVVQILDSTADTPTRAAPLGNRFQSSTGSPAPNAEPLWSPQNPSKTFVDASQQSLLGISAEIGDADIVASLCSPSLSDLKVQQAPSSPLDLSPQQQQQQPQQLCVAVPEDGVVLLADVPGTEHEETASPVNRAASGLQDKASPEMRAAVVLRSTASPDMKADTGPQEVVAQRAAVGSKEKASPGKRPAVALQDKASPVKRAAVALQDKASPGKKPVHGQQDLMSPDKRVAIRQQEKASPDIQALFVRQEGTPPKGAAITRDTMETLDKSAVGDQEAAEGKRAAGEATPEKPPLARQGSAPRSGSRRSSPGDLQEALARWRAENGRLQEENARLRQDLQPKLKQELQWLTVTIATHEALNAELQAERDAALQLAEGLQAENAELKRTCAELTHQSAAKALEAAEATEALAVVNARAVELEELLVHMQHEVEAANATLEAGNARHRAAQVESQEAAERQEAMAQELREQLAAALDELDSMRQRMQAIQAAYDSGLPPEPSFGEELLRPQTDLTETQLAAAAASAQAHAAALAEGYAQNMDPLHDDCLDPLEALCRQYAAANPLFGESMAVAPASSVSAAARAAASGAGGASVGSHGASVGATEHPHEALSGQVRMSTTSINASTGATTHPPEMLGSPTRASMSVNASTGVAAHLPGTLGHTVPMSTTSINASNGAASPHWIQHGSKSAAVPDDLRASVNTMPPVAQAPEYMAMQLADAQDAVAHQEAVITELEVQLAAALSEAAALRQQVKVRLGSRPASPPEIESSRTPELTAALEAALEAAEVALLKAEARAAALVDERDILEERLAIANAAAEEAREALAAQQEAAARAAAQAEEAREALAAHQEAAARAIAEAEARAMQAEAPREHPGICVDATTTLGQADTLRLESEVAALQRELSSALADKQAVEEEAGRVQAALEECQRRLKKAGSENAALRNTAQQKDAELLATRRAVEEREAKLAALRATLLVCELPSREAPFGSGSGAGMGTIAQPSLRGPDTLGPSTGGPSSSAATTASPALPLAPFAQAAVVTAAVAAAAAAARAPSGGREGTGGGTSGRDTSGSSAGGSMGRAGVSGAGPSGAGACKGVAVERRRVGRDQGPVFRRSSTLRRLSAWEKSGTVGTAGLTAAAARRRYASDSNDEEADVVPSQDVIRRRAASKRQVLNTSKSRDSNAHMFAELLERLERLELAHKHQQPAPQPSRSSVRRVARRQLLDVTAHISNTGCGFQLSAPNTAGVDAAAWPSRESTAGGAPATTAATNMPQGVSAGLSIALRGVSVR